VELARPDFLLWLLRQWQLRYKCCLSLLVLPAGPVPVKHRESDQPMQQSLLVDRFVQLFSYMLSGQASCCIPKRQQPAWYVISATGSCSTQMFQNSDAQWQLLRWSYTVIHSGGCFSSEAACRRGFTPELKMQQTISLELAEHCMCSIL